MMLTLEILGYGSHQLRIEDPMRLTLGELAEFMGQNAPWVAWTGWYVREENALARNDEPIGLLPIAEQDHLLLFPLEENEKENGKTERFIR